MENVFSGSVTFLDAPEPSSQRNQQTLELGVSIDNNMIAKKSCNLRETSGNEFFKQNNQTTILLLKKECSLRKRARCTERSEIGSFSRCECCPPFPIPVSLTNCALLQSQGLKAVLGCLHMKEPAVQTMRIASFAS